MRKDVSILEALNNLMPSSNSNSVNTYALTVTAPNETTRKTTTFILHSESEETRDAWVSVLKTNKALADVGTAILDDVVKQMIWDILNSGEFTFGML